MNPSQAREKKSNGAEKRRHPRLSSDFEVPFWKYVKIKKNEEINIGFVKNISQGGMFIETDVVFEIQAKVGFEFYLPTSAQPISGMAVVMWNRSTAAPDTKDDREDAHQVTGMGLKFSQFENDGEARLKAFFQKEADNRT